MKARIVYLIALSLVIAVFASAVAASAEGIGPNRRYRISPSVSFRLYDPDPSLHYYGTPDFYTPFVYYPYSRYLNPPPPVWVAPPPWTIAPNVVSRWLDPNRLQVAYVGETRRTRRIAVAFVGPSQKMTLATPSGLSPYTLAFSPPESAKFIRVRTFDSTGRVIRDILAKMPPR